MQFQDLIYEIRNGVAWIVINRADKMNAFRGTTCDELIKALYKAGYDKTVGAIVLAGAGDRAFCTGGDNVLATICDLTICSEKAVFGQVGPKMGSVDPGYGTAFLSRVVGEKKAREMWYMCRRYSGTEAAAMGLANLCVPHEQLDAEVQ